MVRKEENVIFNDTVQKKIICLYGVGCMVRKEGNVIFNDTVKNI